jgi:hypothetical protein
MFYTSGAWIQAFLKAMNEMLSARSGPISDSGLRFRARVCEKHADCVDVEFDRHHEHVPYKDHDAVYAARSLLHHYRRSSGHSRIR